MGIDALFGGPGVDYGFRVTASGSGLNVIVGKGRAMVNWTATADQGSYLAVNDTAGVTVGPLAAADPTFTRIDSIIIKIRDTAQGDASDGATCEAVTGVVNSGVGPVTPANAILIAQVYIAAGVTSIVQGNINDLRTFMGPNGSPGDFMWGSYDRAPSGWLQCNGQAVSRASYPDLFDVYNRSFVTLPFGAGDGSTTFNIPNSQDRVVQGAAPTVLGGTGGESTHLLTSAECGMPSHTHTISDPGHIHSVNDPNHLHGITDGGHVHSFGGATVLSGPSSVAGAGGTGVVAASTITQTGPTYPGTANISAQNAPTGISVVSGTTGTSAVASSANAGSAHNNRQPYVCMYGYVKT